MEAEFKEGDEVVDRDGQVFTVTHIGVKNDLIILTSSDSNRRVLMGLMVLEKEYVKREKVKP